MAPLTEQLDRLASASAAPVGDRLRRRLHEQRAHLLQLVEGQTAAQLPTRMLTPARHGWRRPSRRRLGREG